jgi:trehalose synthase
MTDRAVKSGHGGVEVRALPPERLTPLIGPERAARFAELAEQARRLLDGRVVLNINSTATGGGVAELLQTLLAYARGAGVDARWSVVHGNPRFFDITKRVHNMLYGHPGDGGPLGDVEHRDYEATLRDNLDRLLPFVTSDDIVVLHDPQSAGLAPALHEAGVTLVWRCHVGVDTPNEYSERAWAFLAPYLEAIDEFVFSVERFAPDFIPHDRLTVIPPSIDPFAAKNEAMLPADVLRALRYVGLIDGADDTEPPMFTFTRRDGSFGTIDARVDDLGTGAAPADVPLVLQVSRWDKMKDMCGVMEGFAAHIDEMHDAHLMLSGPDARGVTDDPEGELVLEECMKRWKRLPRAARERIHLSCVPIVDVDIAAIICNALQRHASIVVQKSLAEGFGLTVVEAMWKSRPVVGSAVGGIIDQIVPGETGYLVQDPHDLDEFADHLRRLLDDASGAARMGEVGRERVIDRFLGDRHLEQWAALFARFA